MMTTSPSRIVRNSEALRSEFRLQFAACYVYSPKGQSDVSERSRQLCARVKSGSRKWLKHYATNIQHEAAKNGRFQGYFEDTLLIPIPDYRPANQTSLWVARRLAIELQLAGLGAEVWTGLHRVSSVERSSSAWMWERPTVEQHYRSFAVIPLTGPHPKQIVLIDDVITKGRTLMAAAMRLRERFPDTEIRAFALVRTMGFVPDVTRVFDPCQGEIHWNGRDAYRSP
jgi:Phosphoribosyl transferase domain